MSGSDYSLNMAINATNNAGGVISNFISSLGPIGGAVAVVGAAAIGVGIASVKMAGDFQQSMTTLVTGAGESQKNIAMVGDGIKKMAVDTGTGTDKLIKAMFTVESAGYRGSQGLQVMQAAAQGAKVGNADLASMTDVLTTSLHNYNLQSTQSVPVVNSFIATVKNGRMEMDDLNQSLTGVLPTASKAGIKLTDVEGALAEMAASGDKGASAGTHLSQMFQSLQNPTSAASGVLKSIGLTTQQISDDMKKSLPDTIQTIYDSLAKKFPVGSAAFNAAAAKIVGGNKQVKAWNELTGNSFQGLVDSTKNIAGAYNNSGSAVTDFNLVQQNFNFKMDQARQAINVLLITLGQQFLPILTRVMGWVVPLVTNFTNWITASNGLGAVMSPLVEVFNQIGEAFQSVLLPVKALTPATKPMREEMQKCIAVAAPVANKLRDVAVSVLKVTHHVKEASPVFKFFAAVFQTAASTIRTVMDNLIPPILLIAHNVIDVTKKFVEWGVKSGLFTTIINLLGGAIGIASGIIGGILGAIGKFIGFLASGTPGANAFKIAVLGVAAALVLIKIGQLATSVVGFIGMIPEIVATYGFWAGAAWSVAVAQLAALAPLLLIGIAVVAVIVIIVLLATHWKQVTQAVGNFSSALGTKVRQIVSGIGQAFSSLGTKVHEIWNGITSFLGAAWAWIQNAAKIAFTALILIIIGPIGDLVVLIVTHWSQIKSFLATTWAWITNLAGNAWQALTNIITTRIQNAKNNITNWWGDIRSFFANLPGEMETWGIDMIQGLINGITSMIGNLTSKVQGVAQSIAKFLHFTKPDAGPLATVDEWMPHMGDTLIEGLNKISPKLQAAALRAAMSVSSPFSAGNTGSPAHIIDFIGSNYSGYNQGMATTRKRTASETKQLEKLEATLEKNIDAYEHPKPIKWDKTAKGRAHQEAAFEKAQAKREAALEKEEANIQKLENHYHITVNHTGKGKWTKQDADELAKLIADQARLQGKHPQTASGRRN